MKVALHDVAHSRAGDKGHLITLSLVPYDPSWFEVLKAAVQPEDVQRHLRDRVVGEVVRFELPLLPALTFVCARRTTDSVTTSLHVDGHGKTMSSALLEMEIEVSEDLVGSIGRGAGRADGRQGGRRASTDR
jgi:hypothetical protein